MAQSEICEKEKVFLLDASISKSGLFGEAVSSVVEKFRSAKMQSAALKQFMPRRTRDHSTPSSSLSRYRSLPRKEPSGRSGAQAAHPPPTMVWGARGRPFPRQRPRRRVEGARFKLDRHVSVGTCRRLLGLMAVASPVFPLGLLHMRLFLWWMKEVRLHPTIPATRLIRVSRRLWA